MIWNPSHPAAPARGAADRPADTLATVGAALGLSAAVLDEVLQAVAAFGADAGPDRIAPGWHLARALWSVGEPAAAHALADGLLADGAANADARRALEQRAFDPHLGFLLEARVLRPLRWQHQPEQPGWALDFSRLQRDTAGDMALFRLRGLLGMLETLAGLWDVTHGRGTLALKSWPAPREAEDVCRAFLERCRPARGWRTAPQVVHLH